MNKYKRFFKAMEGFGTGKIYSLGELEDVAKHYGISLSPENPAHNFRLSKYLLE